MICQISDAIYILNWTLLATTRPRRVVWVAVVWQKPLPDADFQKLATPPLLKNQPSVHSSILLTFFPPFESTFQFPSRKFPIFLCYISSWRALNYEHHSFSPQFLVFQLLLPFLFLVSSDLKWLRYWISFCSSLIGLLK